VRISLSKGVDDPNFTQLVASIKKWNPLGRRDLDTRNVEEPVEDLGWLLPHLVNRTRQELVLKSYVHAVLTHRISHPGVFLLRGREDECGDVFIERIARRAMPEVLRGASLGAYVYFTQVNWPRHDDDISGEARYQTLISSIRTALSSAGGAQGIVLRVQLPVDGWGGRADRALLKKFVHHWRDPRSRVSTYTPILMIADVSYGTGVLGSLWGRWVLRRTNRVFRPETPFLSRTLNLVRGWPWRELFRRSSQVPATENSGHATNQSRPVAALPKLTRVSHADAMNWIREHRSALKTRDPTDARLALAPQFRRPLGLGNRRIPMEKAVVALRSLLTDAAASGAAI
jgi:hypothetical protein